MAIEVGQKAPAFSLQNTDKAHVSLESFQGKSNVVILFFPLAFSGVCTTELCSTRDNISIYEGLDAEILAISVDSFFTLEAFKKDNRLQFQLLSDFNKTASTDYGTLNEDFFGMHGVSNRAAFVVDKEGVIRYAEVLPQASDLPNFEAIQETLKSL